MQLPNGMITHLRESIPIIFEIRALKDFSPRIMSSMKIFNIMETINLKNLVVRLKNYVIEAILSKFSLHQSQVQAIVNEFIDKHLTSVFAQLQKLNQRISVIGLHRQLKVMIKVIIKEVQVLKNLEEDL